MSVDKDSYDARQMDTRLATCVRCRQTLWYRGLATLGLSWSHHPWWCCV